MSGAERPLLRLPLLLAAGLAAGYFLFTAKLFVAAAAGTFGLLLALATTCLADASLPLLLPVSCTFVAALLAWNVTTPEHWELRSL